MKTNNLHKTPDVAEILKCSSFAIRHSRSTGILLGVPAPEFIKIGSAIYYSDETIQNWIIDNSRVFKNTAEAAGDSQ